MKNKKKSKTTQNVTDAVARPPRQAADFSMTKLISFGLLLTVIVVLGIVFYRVMASFLVPMFLAALLVVIFEPVHQWFLRKCDGRQAIAAGLTTTAVMLTVLVPLGLLLVFAIAEAQSMFQTYRSPKVAQSLTDLRERLNLDMPSAAQFSAIESRFNSLHQQLRRDEMEKQGLGLSEIYQNASEIAGTHELPWPPTAQKDQESDETAKDARDPAVEWEIFSQHVAAARAIESKADWTLPSYESAAEGRREGGDEDGSQEKYAAREQQRHSSLQEYQLELDEASTHFAKFKVRFLGGSARALFTQMVNPSDEDVASYAQSLITFAKDTLLRLGGATSAFLGSLLLGTAIMIFSLYFFLLDGEKMLESIKGLSPLDDQHETELIDEFGRVSRAVVVATLLSALAQGVLAGAGFYVCGLDSIFLLTLLSAVLAMVPFVGAASVWIPCSLYLYFVDQNVTAAIGLAIYGVAVISMADNVIKPLVLHGQSNLHPLLALLSVIGGVSTLGPIGILVGPMIVVFLQTLLKILRRELDGIEHGQPSA